TGSGASCTSGGKTFYETCLVKETCVERNVAGGFVGTGGHSDMYIGPYCTTQTGKVLNLYAWCDSPVVGVLGKCAGKKFCPGNQGHQNNGSTEPCRCANGLFFDACDDTCNYDGLSANGGYCSVQATSSVNAHYYVKDKCTASNGIVLKYFASCTGRDCLGNRGPCVGKVACDSSTIAVDPCTCGGVTWGSSCVVKCPYEQTAADCKAGQTFTQRCKDNAGTWFGECK
ncbi:MAG: hypothetical protein Q4F75_08525, partial [Pseudomonadota bacterium]|nr:hypothetical protein [Pseudomonadota bacterium]